MTSWQNRLGAIALAMLSAGMVIAALLGPMAIGIIDFRTTHSVERQFVGADWVTVLLVVPTAFVAAVLWWRGRAMAPLMGLSVTLFAVYTYSSAILGQEYGRYPGNVERAVPLYLALVASAVGIAHVAWMQLPSLTVSADHPHRRALAIVLMGGGLVIVLAWSVQIAAVLTGNPSMEYQEAPTCFWVIRTFDLGFVVPIAVITGLGLHRGDQWTARPAVALTGFLTAMVASIDAMAISMTLNNDPSAQPVLIAVLTPAFLWLGRLTWKQWTLVTSAAGQQPESQDRASGGLNLRPMHLA